MEALDLLQEVIDDYGGTVLLVSLDGSGSADVVVGAETTMADPDALRQEL